MPSKVSVKCVCLGRSHALLHRSKKKLLLTICSWLMIYCVFLVVFS